jgi:hypothetical protein
MQPTKSGLQSLAQRNAHRGEASQAARMCAHVHFQWKVWCTPRAGAAAVARPARRSAAAGSHGGCCAGRQAAHCSAARGSRRAATQVPWGSCDSRRSTWRRRCRRCALPEPTGAVRTCHRLAAVRATSAPFLSAPRANCSGSATCGLKAVLQQLHNLTSDESPRFRSCELAWIRQADRHDMPARVDNLVESAGLATLLLQMETLC